MEQPHRPTAPSTSSQRQQSPGSAIATRNGIILQLNRPGNTDPYHLYQRDVFKWRMRFSSSGSTYGLYLREGRLVERAPLSTQHPIDILDRLPRLKVPLIPHPIRKPSCEPSPPWEDQVLEAYCIGYADQYSVSITPQATIELQKSIPHGIPGDWNDRPFKIQPDTGSNALWVFGEEFDPRNELPAFGTPIHTCYFPGTAARPLGENTFRNHEDNQLIAMGTVYDDTWNFPTSDGAALDLRMKFGVAKEVGFFFSQCQIDGILGLSFVPTQENTSSPTEPDHFLTALRARGVISNFIFCMCLNMRGDRSFLSLGCIPEECPTPHHWIPVIPGACRWLIPCHAIGWGVSPEHNQFEDLTFSAPIQVLIDSGTTNCFFSDDVLAFVYERLQGKPNDNGYIIPSRRLPGIEMQRIWINLDGEWMLWPLEGLYTHLWNGEGPSNDKWFDGTLKSQGVDFPFSILGSVFFEDQYVYFDADPSAPKVAFEARPPEIKIETEKEIVIIG